MDITFRIQRLRDAPLEPCELCGELVAPIYRIHRNGELLCEPKPHDDCHYGKQDVTLSYEVGSFLDITSSW